MLHIFMTVNIQRHVKGYRRQHRMCSRILCVPMHCMQSRCPADIIIIILLIKVTLYFAVMIFFESISMSQAKLFIREMNINVKMKYLVIAQVCMANILIPMI